MTPQIEVGATKFRGTIRIDGELAVQLVGIGDDDTIDAIDELFARAHMEALRARAPRVTIDIRALEYMSSSCFKSLLIWITDIEELAPEKQYQLLFVINDQLHWHRRSMQSLRSFATSLIRVTSAHPPPQSS